MDFNSFQYIIFLVAVVIANFLLPSFLSRIMLLAASFYFYMCWNPKYSLLMLLSIVITYVCGILINKFSSDKKAQKQVLFVATLANLLILFYFKYFNFVIDCINGIFKSQFNFIDVLLPIGISFYIFQAIGYTIDVYRGRLQAEKNFINYALFVSFFPQLVAGPIERSTNMLNQFKVKPKVTLDNMKNGCILILFGLVEKIVIADRIAIVANAIFNNSTQMSSLFLVLGAVFFSIQIYADFSSYTHIARGSAQLLGYSLMKNFETPYLAPNIKSFWKRWHISLTSWFTDYLYIPLGGSRVSPPRIYMNIIIVFLVSGLWHGASLTFLAWGALHAIAQVIFKLYDKYVGVKLMFVNHIITYGFVCFSYIFFRAQTIDEALVYIGRMFSFTSASIGNMLQILNVSQNEFYVALAIVVFVFAVDILRKIKVDALSWLCQKPILVQSLVYSFMLILIVTLGIYGEAYVDNPFIYFQF